jgi:hypothetical protein
MFNVTVSLTLKSIASFIPRIFVVRSPIYWDSELCQRSGDLQRKANACGDRRLSSSSLGTSLTYPLLRD